MIEFRGVSHAFSGVPVLSGINLALGEKRIAVIGGNGSGKSTLARMLNGLIVPDAGEVFVDGLSTRTHGRQVRLKVGLVFQNPEHQIVMPTVEEDLAFGPRNIGLDAAETEARMAELLNGYGLAAKRHLPAHALSGGEKKLLTLLSVLIMRPDYIVFDEPLNSLDLAARRRFSATMDALPQTLITITHDFDIVEGYDRALLLEGGRIAADGPPADVIAAYRNSLACPAL